MSWIGMMGSNGQGEGGSESREDGLVRDEVEVEGVEGDVVEDKGTGTRLGGLGRSDGIGRAK